MPAQKRTLTGKAASQTTILPRLDFVDLRLVINVAAAKSLTRGAELSVRSPAAASMRVKNVEDAIGTALLYRGKRGISPTPAGEAFLRHAQASFSSPEAPLRGRRSSAAAGPPHWRRRSLWRPH